MRVMSPEKCERVLDEHCKMLRNSMAKLQIIQEYFEEVSKDGEERTFIDFAMFSTGIVVICGELINGICAGEVYSGDLLDSIRLFSPDPVKVKNHVEYLKSLGITRETPEIELAE